MTFRDVIGRGRGDGGVPAHGHDAADISGEAVFTDLTVDHLLSGTIRGKEIIVAGGADGAIQSDNFDTGVDGWQILGDGSAELNNVTVRGTIIATDGQLSDLDITGDLTLGVSGRILSAASGVRIELSSDAINEILFYTGHASEEEPGAIEVGDSSTGGAGQIGFLQIRSPEMSAVGQAASISLEGSSDTGGRDASIDAFAGDGTILLRADDVRFGTGINKGRFIDGDLRLADGSAAAPPLAFLNDTDTGFYRESSALAVAAAGSRVFRFSGSWIRSDVTFDLTTSNAANLTILSDGEFRRSTSSARYKTDIEAWDRRHSVLGVTPTLFRSLADDDAPDTRRLGLIAEDVAEHFPLAAIHDDEGQPDAIDWNSILAGLIAEVQALRKELAHAD